MIWTNLTCTAPMIFSTSCEPLSLLLAGCMAAAPACSGVISGSLSHDCGYCCSFGGTSSMSGIFGGQRTSHSFADVLECALHTQPCRLQRCLCIS